jgi:putative serine protease PepD
MNGIRAHELWRETLAVGVLTTILGGMVLAWAGPSYRVNINRAAIPNPQGRQGRTPNTRRGHPTGCGVTPSRLAEAKAIPATRRPRRLPSHRARPVSARQRLAWFGRVLLRALAIALITGSIGAATALLAHSPATSSQTFIPAHPAAAEAANFPALPSVEYVADTVLSSLVMLQTEIGGESEQGSGIILTPDGLIITNNHVVAALGTEPRESVRTVVTLNDGHTAPFDVVAADPKSDIAIVRAEGISGLNPISIGSSTDLRVGQPVVAVGSPLGLQNTITTGVISALNRPVFTVVDGNDSLAAFAAIQTDAALNPGSSGGALVDMHGRLIGMNAAMAALGGSRNSGYTQTGSIGISFAIPVEDAERITGELIATGRASHGWLGVQARDDANTYGARIVGVASEGPAAAAGLSSGDLVTRVDSQAVRSANALIAAAQSKPPSAPMTLEVDDPSGVHRTVQVILGNDQGRS